MNLPIIQDLMSKKRAPAFKTRGLRREREAAVECNVPPSTLVRLRRQGKIGFYKVGKIVLYGPQHLEDLLKQSEREPDRAA